MNVHNDVLKISASIVQGAEARALTDLFDYLVGQQLERVRHGEAEGGGGLEINDQFVFDRELNGQIARI
jgi:hypothetical protein